jgi:CRISPR-associated protein Csd1
MPCSVCGQYGPVLERAKETVRGVPGSQGTGVGLTNANEEAFWSYGLQNGLTCPLCPECAHQATSAATALLREETTHYRLGDAVCIAWTRRPVAFDLLSDLTNPDPAHVRDLIASVRTGQRQPAIEDNAYYACWLAARDGRLIVRGWLEGTVEQAQQNSARWFTEQAIVDAVSAETRYYKLGALAYATLRQITDNTKEDQGETSAKTTNSLLTAACQDLLAAALTGAPIPRPLLGRTLERCRRGDRIEDKKTKTLTVRRVTPARAALIKLALSRGGYTIMPEIDLTNTHPAYLCGRLLAVLQAIQHRALGYSVGRTVLETYYGRAATHPGLVLPALVSQARQHLGTMRRGGGSGTGAAIYWDRALQDIFVLFDAQGGFPPSLKPLEQGLFQLGFYQQEAEHERRRKENKLKKAAQGQTVDDLDALDQDDDEAQQPITDIPAAS